MSETWVLNLSDVGRLVLYDVRCERRVGRRQVVAVVVVVEDEKEKGEMCRCLYRRWKGL